VKKNAAVQVDPVANLQKRTDEVFRKEMGRFYRRMRKRR